MPYIGRDLVRGQNREIDDISSSFNGSTTAFTLQVGSVNTSPGSANQLFVCLGGVMQNPNTDYTVDASTITFTTAPASGLTFWALIQGDTVDINTAADGSITTIKLGADAVTTPKLATQTGNVDWNDSGKARFGTGNDLELYHSGAHSFLLNKTGTFYIKGDTFSVNKEDGTNMLWSDGSEWRMFDNGHQVLTTYSQGIKLKGTEGDSAGIHLIADEGDDNGDTWRINSNQDDNDLTFANDTGGSLADKMTLTKEGVLDAAAFTGTDGTGWEYDERVVGNINVPHNSYTTISSDYGWALPSAGTYLLVSSMRVRVWGVSGYIHCRLYDTTNTSALSGTTRMMFEQANSSTPVGQYNTQVTLHWVHTCTGAVTINQQFSTNNDSTNTSIQDDTNGHNYTYWQRIG